MATIIGGARHDENGNYTGGKAGDQLQSGSGDDYSGECSMCDFYVHKYGWYVIRAKETALANKLAERMITLCNNAHIGYDQDGRYGIITYGIDTTTNTECDCSTGVRECVKEASGKDPGDFTTANEVSVLEATGLFEAKIAYTSSTKLYVGDILVSQQKGHTVIICYGDARSGSTSSGTTSSGTSSTKVADAQSGPDNSIAGTYTVTASSLNIRYGPSTSYDVRTTVAKGGTVQCYGYYSTTNGVRWLYVQVSNVTGFASSEWLTKAAGDTTATSSSNKLSVDGQIGAKTVKKLQQVLGATADGFIDGQPSNGRQYWLSIISEACRWTGGTSATVKKWQQYLKDAGYSPSGVDGKLGKNTAKAAQKYLIAKGFSCGSAGADGKFGTASAKGLQQWLNTK